MRGGSRGSASTSSRACARRRTGSASRGDRRRDAAADRRDDADSIARRRAARRRGRLAGLVNNAGVAVPAPIEHQPIDDFRRQIEVNLIGQVAVTQAFLPQLRTARGRIVNIELDRRQGRRPAARRLRRLEVRLEGFSDTLRRELRPWGIEVCVIEPGTIATPIWDKGIASGDELEADA